MAILTGLGALAGAKLTQKVVEHLTGKVTERLVEEFADRAADAVSGLGAGVGDGVRRLLGGRPRIDPERMRRVLGAAKRDGAGKAAAATGADALGIGALITEEMGRLGVSMVANRELAALRAVAAAAAELRHGGDARRQELERALDALAASQEGRKAEPGLAD